MPTRFVQAPTSLVTLSTTKGGGLRIGGVGSVRYHVMGRNAPLCATMQMLARFGQYSGAGIGTTHGMGQIWLDDD